MKIRTIVSSFLMFYLFTISACSQTGSTPAPQATRQPATSFPTQIPLTSLHNAKALALPTATPQAGSPTPAKITPTPTIDPPSLTPSPTPPAPSQVIGFFVNWDDNSFTSLKANFNHLDELIPEWLHLSNASGAIQQDDPAREGQVLAFLKQQSSNLRVVPLINNYSNDLQNWDAKSLSKMLAVPQARLQNIQALLDYVQKNGYAGISIDYESVPPGSQADLVSFMQELYARFHPLGLEVSQSVPFDDETFNFSALASATDFLILMAYDQHWDTSDPGPVAGQNWFENLLRLRLSELPADHVVVGIGNFGYDWLGDTSTSQAMTFHDVLKQTSSSNAQIGLDPISLNPTFVYTATTTNRQVWYLDAITAFNHLVSAQQYGPRGYAMWVLGSEDPGVWQVFDHRDQLDQSVAESLQALNDGYNSQSTAGSRSIKYDPTTGLITDEQILTYPSP